MVEKKFKKTGRNFYIPDWVNEVLDLESERYGGPGVVTSSAILAFSSLTDEQKAIAVKAFRNKEIERAYTDIDIIVENTAKDVVRGRSKTQKSHKSPKAS